MSRLEQLEKLLSAEPGDVFLNFALAMEYLKMGRHAEALAQFDRVNELDPNYVAAYFQKGNALLALGRREEAKAVLTRGVEAAQRTGNTHAAGEMGDLLKALG
ncbi:MAG TPA: tetratricopeptide repeat protein [Phycisphaerae bacterium]|jgi:tetratricopeptide (TPR) repeat protein|nr:tetratricopeptide repeat protein [Phycisphaerae bacterium]HOB73932.1 tetratricopeptide repeat protein [Phycisphaerae bacterium]HOJ56270.1 tetratricopeptide repeat protein [Phycisphaerae bacterium]HOL28138.1 tetratricopeptide repeat protein [Phycisphaerae bacterium]HPP19751.1 tetratricopeptide repeat protein [Phycisphaerae bacterium]